MGMQPNVTVGLAGLQVATRQVRNAEGQRRTEFYRGRREEVRRWLFPGRRERKKGGMGRGRSPLQYALEQDEMGAHQRRRRKKGKKEPEESGERVVVFSSIHREDCVKERRKRTRPPKKKLAAPTPPQSLHFPPQKRVLASAPQHPTPQSEAWRKMQTTASQYNQRKKTKKSKTKENKETALNPAVNP